MQEKITNLLADSSSRKKIIIALILVGVILVVFSSGTSSSYSKKKSTEQTTASYSDYTSELEAKLEKTVSSIEGVGECRVMITLARSGENVYAKNSESKNDESSNSKNDNYVLYDSDSGESPLLINEYFPDVQGVAIVCTGGDNAAVKEQIISTVSSLFSIPTNRISVSKIKG